MVQKKKKKKRRGWGGKPHSGVSYTFAKEWAGAGHPPLLVLSRSLFSHPPLFLILQVFACVFLHPQRNPFQHLLSSFFFYSLFFHLSWNTLQKQLRRRLYPYIYIRTDFKCFFTRFHRLFLLCALSSSSFSFLFFFFFIFYSSCLRKPIAPSLTRTCVQPWLSART